MAIKDHKHHIFQPEIHQEHILKRAQHMIHKNLWSQAYYQFIKSYITDSLASLKCKMILL